MHGWLHGWTGMRDVSKIRKMLPYLWPMRHCLTQKFCVNVPEPLLDDI